MTDIVTRMKETACPANTGCMSIKVCVCDVMGDAVDEIERLREEIGRMNGRIDNLHWRGRLWPKS